MLDLCNPVQFNSSHLIPLGSAGHTRFILLGKLFRKASNLRLRDEPCGNILIRLVNCLQGPFKGEGLSHLVKKIS